MNFIFKAMSAVMGVLLMMTLGFATLYIIVYVFLFSLVKVVSQ